MSDLTSDYIADDLYALNLAVCDQCGETVEREQMEQYQHPDGTKSRWCKTCCQVEDEAKTAACDICHKDWPAHRTHIKQTVYRDENGHPDMEELCICESCHRVWEAGR